MCLIIILHLLFLIFATHEQEFDENSYDLRRKILSAKIKHNVTAKRIKLLDKMLDNYSILVDDITYYYVEKHPKVKKVKQFEREFRNIIAMNGVRYVYKRDMIWRTWAKESAKKGAKIVHYKFETPIKCKRNCGLVGYWLIENQTPPCPYEIFSTNDNTVCALNITTYDKFRTKCSSHLLSLLTTCDNPIDTKWIIEKKYGKKNGTFPVAICGKREYCTITTLYKINPDSISFQIINKSNHILYSRLMKNGGKNYACVEKCGIYDPKTSKTIKNEKPLKLNMLKKVHKREESRKSNSNLTLGFFIHNFEKAEVTTTHRPSCKNLQHNHSVEIHEDDSEEDYYFI